MSSMPLARETSVNAIRTAGPRPLQAKITGASAWRRDDLHTDNYLIPMSGTCFDEIRRAADEIGQHKLPTIVRRPEDFEMPACRAAMAELRRMLRRGVRFAIVDRLPLDE